MSKYGLLMFVSASFLAVGLLLQFSSSGPTVNATESPTPGTNYDDIFNAELEKNLDHNHETVMSALRSQAGTLSRIEEGLNKEVVSVIESEPLLTSPVRMSTTRWSVGGSWNPSKSQLIQHLTSHDVDASDSYTLAELHVMHDNVHNGYSAMGDNVVSSSAGGWGRTKSVTRTHSSSRGGLFSGRLFRSRSYNSCAGGSCR